MPTESDLTAFLNRVPADGSTIGNGALRDALKWESEHYDAVRDALVYHGRLEKGRGRGGSVRRIAAPSSSPGTPLSVAALQPPLLDPIRRLALPGSTKPQPLARVAPVGVVKAQPKAGNVMFEQTFKNIDDILHKDAGCTSELDYTEQSSWLLFLKYLDALEQDKATEAALEGKPYTFILDKPYRWESWAAPKGADGTVDHNTAMTGDDLRDFVNHQLCPYLQGFKQRATGPNTIEYKIGEIFSEIKNKIQSGYNLRDVVEHIDELKFASQSDKHELSHLYEAKIKNMGNAGRNGGEYYTPRPLIRAIIQVVKPKIGQRIYDGAVGSAGFLCEAFDYLSNSGVFPGNAALRSCSSLTAANTEIGVPGVDHAFPGNAALRSGASVTAANAEIGVPGVDHAFPGNAALRSCSSATAANAEIGVPRVDHAFPGNAALRSGSSVTAANTEIGVPGGISTSDLKTLQERTFYGKEKKSLAYVIAIMNMILHGIEAPNIVHTNTLAENLSDIQDKDRVDVVLANPPFGGKERKEVQQNFPIRTGETAFLFLQHFIKMLKAGGRGGVVIKNTFLSNTDNASVSLRKLLLESCNLHTVLDCPGGTFQGAGVKTVVLFFEKGAPTRKVWYYQLDPGRNMGKTNPLNDADLVEFVELQKTFADSPKSWSVDVATIDKATFDLSVKNPNGGEVVAHRSPQEIMDEIAALDAESAEVLENIRRLL